MRAQDAFTTGVCPRVYVSYCYTILSDALGLSCSDYAALPHLDRYDTSELDTAEYGALTTEQRRRAEAAMAMRDTRGPGARIPAALLPEEEEEVRG